MSLIFSNKILFSALLLSVFGLSFGVTLPEAIDTDCTRISPAIIADLNDFTKLIDPAVLDGIVAEHLLFDNDFRKAMEYMQKKDFEKLMKDLRNVPEVVDILDFLKVLVPCEGSELDVPLLEIVLLEAMEKDKNYHRYRRHRHPRSVEPPDAQLSSMPSAYELNSLTSFLEDVLKELPKTKYVNLIKAKCEKSNEFKTFYTSLRSPVFKQKVDATLKSKNLESFLKELKSHSVDAVSLEPVVLKLISWGPNV